MARTNRLRIEALEDRIVPALNFQFDYRFDSAGFFNDPARRAILEQVGQQLGSRIDTDLQAIVPSGGNSWSAMIFNPATGTQATVPGLVVPADTIVVFAGARNLSGGQAAVGGTGGYSAGGSSSWFNTLANRGAAFGVWGGSLTIDTDQNWFFGSTTAGLTAQNVDFYTVATHELGHVLGFGTSANFDQWLTGRNFNGSHAVAANGGISPTVSADLSHWSQGTNSDGDPTSMQPYLLSAQRYGFSDLDYAALADIGWTITDAAPTVPVVTPPVVGSPGPAPVVDTLHPPIVLPGSADGLAHIVRYINGQLVADANAVRPFANYYGVIQSVVADVTGDSVQDIVYATGSGGPSRFTIVDGATGYSIIPTQTPFGSEFTGGLYLASGDFNLDGKADIIVSADNGGGGRVSVFRYAANAVTRVGDFFGIEDPWFRGGARVAAADVNGDGTPDMIVGAGFGGGPRVAIFDGKTISQSVPRKLVGDFFAFPGDAVNTLRNGVYVTASDLNSDGKADLIFGAGPGGGPLVYALSGAKILANDLAGAFTAPLLNFFAFDINQRGGVKATVVDVNRDGTKDLVVASGTTGTMAWYRNMNPALGQTYTATSPASPPASLLVEPTTCGCPVCSGLANGEPAF